jgi:hypothetical protein
VLQKVSLAALASPFHKQRTMQTNIAGFSNPSLVDFFSTL